MWAAITNLSYCKGKTSLLVQEIFIHRGGDVQERISHCKYYSFPLKRGSVLI